MSDRDELTRLIADALGDSNNGNLSKFVADQVIAAGYRRPVASKSAEALYFRADHLTDSEKAMGLDGK